VLFLVVLLNEMMVGSEAIDCSLPPRKLLSQPQKIPDSFVRELRNRRNFGSATGRTPKHERGLIELTDWIVITIPLMLAGVLCLTFLMLAIRGWKVLMSRPGAFLILVTPFLDACRLTTLL
jgi:hypothetical protein